MTKAKLLNQQNEVVGELELDSSVFEASVNLPLIHQVLKAQLAARRVGNAKTKTKAEVRGGGKKPYKQKGTGNARRGSNRSALMVGGGVAHGPKLRSYFEATPKKMVRGALRGVLSDRFKSDRILFLDQISIQDPKTKHVAELIENKFNLEKVLIIDGKNENLERAGRNLPGTRILRSEGLNVYDVLKAEWVLITKGAVLDIQERLRA